MGRKVKFKVKPGKLKVKLKSDDATLPLSEASLRDLLALGMASALRAAPSPGAGSLEAASGSPALSAAVEVSEEGGAVARGLLTEG